jgi:toluene monooxygenase electron transfer component
MRIQVNARNRAFQFQASPGEKILYAGLRAQTGLPYECATGTCGTCKARLVEGQVDDAWPEAPGRKFLKADRGEFLMCQCSPRGDVSIEVASFVYPADPGAYPVTPLAGTVSAVRPLTHDVSAVEVTLDAPCGFDAGQFMAVGAPGVPGMRGYSMVNCDQPATRLSFVVKKKPGGGFSEWLFAGKALGARLDMVGPLGKATFHPGMGKNVLCIAGGSGIAGMMSILARAAADDYFARHKVYVYFGVRTMRDAFFLEELSAYPQAEITIALSDEDVPESAARDWPNLRFERGFVHEVAKRAMAGRYQDVRAYLAGPPPAVEAAIRVLLLEAKLTADCIRYDKFS